MQTEFKIMHYVTIVHVRRNGTPLGTTVYNYKVSKSEAYAHAHKMWEMKLKDAGMEVGELSVRIETDRPVFGSII